MSTSTFFTRHQRCSFLRQFVRENSGLSFELKDLNRLFTALDQYCAEHLTREFRGGWFPLIIAGGAPLHHTPPHLFYTAYAIFSHLAHGDVDPVPFLGAPLNRDGATALQLDLSSGFLVEDRDGTAFAMTDALFLLPALTQKSWTMDFFGLPPFREGVEVVAWHVAAQPHVTAVASGQLLLHVPSGQVLDPLGLFTLEEEARFFTEPAPFSKLQRYRERMEEWLGTPATVLKTNFVQARGVLEASLAHDQHRPWAS